MERSRGDVLQDRERVHAAGAMLDEQNVKGNSVCISNTGGKVQPSIGARTGRGDFNGAAGSAEAFARERRVSNVQQLDAAPWRWLRDVDAHTRRWLMLPVTRGVLCNRVNLHAPRYLSVCHIGSYRRAALCNGV